MSPDYGLYTFITSVLILLMQLHVVERANTLVKRSVVSEGGSQLSYLGLSRGRNVVERSGFMVYEDGEIPHPSYVKVAGPDEIPVEIDVLAELAKLRVAANTQREVLVAANRMPPETVISKMIAERTRAYMEEDAKAATVELPGGEPISPKSVDQPTKKPTSSVGVPGMGSMPTKSSPESPVSSLELLPGILMQTYPQSIGVILGVGAGQFVLTLLKGWSNTAGLYLVDPYIHIFRGYDDPANVDDKSHQLIFEHLRNQLVPYQSKFAFIRDFSYECQQAQLSFVWVDANHALEAVLRDISDWYPLLRSQGMIAGSSYAGEVKQVVDKFARNSNLEVFVIPSSQPTPSWLIVKY